MNELTLSIGALNSVFARLIYVDKLFVHFQLYITLLYNTFIL